MAIRLLGYALVARAAVLLAGPLSALTVYGFSDFTALMLGPAFITGAVGLLLVRQGAWISGRLAPRAAPTVRVRVPYDGVRDFVFGVVGFAAILASIKAVAWFGVTSAEVDTLGRDVQLYLVAGYLTLALGVLIGPVRLIYLLRGMRPPRRRWRPALLDVRGVERTGLLALGVWFGVATLTGVVRLSERSSMGFLSSELPALVSVAASAGAAFVLLRAGARRRSAPDASLRVALEMVAVILLFQVIPHASLLAIDHKVFLVSGILTAVSPATVACVFVSSAALLTWAWSLGRREATAPLTDVFQ